MLQRSHSECWVFLPLLVLHIPKVPSFGRWVPKNRIVGTMIHIILSWLVWVVADCPKSFWADKKILAFVLDLVYRKVFESSGSKKVATHRAGIVLCGSTKTGDLIAI